MGWFDRRTEIPSPPAEEFRTWVSVEDAFRHIPNGVSRLQSDAMLRSLEAGELRAAAKIVMWSEGDQPRSRVLMGIDPSWWPLVDDRPESPYQPRQAHYDNLWLCGRIDFRLPDLASPEVVYDVAFMSVHFEPVGLEKVLSRPALPAIQRPIDPYDECREWLSARDARELVNPLYDNRRLAEKALIAEAAAERIATRCALPSGQKERSPRPAHYGEHSPLNGSFWREYEAAGDSCVADWIAGRFTHWTFKDHARKETAAHGVEFSAEDIRRVFRLRDAPVVAPAAARDEAFHEALSHAAIRALQARAPASELTSPRPETGPATPRMPAGGESPDDRKPLSPAEQRRFCELLVNVHGHEAATESFARQAVAALYPDHKVSRDGFREILREVRELQGPIRAGRPRVRGE